MNKEWQLYEYDTTINYQYALCRIKNEEKSLLLLFTDKRNHLVHPIDKKTMVVADFPGGAEEIKILKTLSVNPNYVKHADDIGWIFEVPENAKLKRYIFLTDRDIVEVVSATPPLIREEKI